MSDPKCKHGKTVLFCDECYSRESGRQMSSYEAWRISFQDSEQAAKAAFNQVQTLQHSLATAEAERDGWKYLCEQRERELAELRREVERLSKVFNAAVDYVDRASGPNIDSFPEFQHLQTMVRRFQKELQPTTPHEVNHEPERG